MKAPRLIAFLQPPSNERPLMARSADPGCPLFGRYRG
jgi:hypothetical protein